MSLLTGEMDCTGKFNAKVKADLILRVKYSEDSLKSFIKTEEFTCEKFLKKS